MPVTGSVREAAAFSHAWNEGGLPHDVHLIFKIAAAERRHAGAHKRRRLDI